METISKVRTIPSSLKLSVMFKNVFAILGISFTLIGGVSFILCASLVNFNSLRISDRDPQTNGKITEIISTNTKVNRQRIYEYRFTYSVQSQDFYGASYDVRNNLAQGDTVLVIYANTDPQISVIKGMSSSAMPIWVLFVVMIFPATGLGFLIFTCITGLKNIRLLEYGEVAYGKLLSSEPTSGRINNRIVYKMTFEFTVSNEKRIAIAQTHKPENLRDERGERLVYDRGNPSNALLIDSLPAEVKLFFDRLERGY
ncbi:hypothetical protein TUMEXPCC7403_14250 [Tumidithrix helvetica PCC 7403]|uniref:DUF3592 domain-containing protein n=1 Tax=Tumidithrix helvetica TaxID=3457545 RepID=UPI003CB70984